jgi:hypothetical protein
MQDFFDHYVKGSGAQPSLDVTATIETCPSSAPSGGPFSAPTWSALHPGEVDFSSGPAQTILSTAGNPAVAQAFDPISGKGACATAPATDQGSGVATYRLPAVTGSGYTLLGSPTVIANLTVSGQFPFIAARLLDVDPSSNTETLVARGIYRIDSNAPNGVQVFQLHPGAWHFAAGHIPKLELLGQDSPYARTSNGQFQIQVSGLQLRLPVHEAPGTAPGVGSPKPPFSSHPGPSCTPAPSSKIFRRRSHVRRGRLLVTGSASERRCAHSSAASRRRQRVVRVFVVISRPAAHGRCRFVGANGHLSRARSCKRPIELRARGTSHWRLRLRLHLPRGRYFIRSDAVDGFRRHQHRTRASRIRLHLP